MTRSFATTGITIGKRVSLKKANRSELNNLKLTPCFSILSLSSTRTNQHSTQVTKTVILMATATLLLPPQPKELEHSTQQNNRPTQMPSRPMVAITTLITSSITPNRPKQRACPLRSILTNITLITPSTLNITIISSNTLTPIAANHTSKQPTHFINHIRAHTQPAAGRSLTKAKDGDASGAEPKDDNEVNDLKT